MYSGSTLEPWNVLAVIISNFLQIHTKYKRFNDNLFILYLQKKVLDVNYSQNRFLLNCVLEMCPTHLFVILDAILCVLKCIFVLIDDLLWHTGRLVFFRHYNTALTVISYSHVAEFVPFSTQLSVCQIGRAHV